MTNEENTLETAAAALHAAQEAVHRARGRLTAAIVNAYRAGERVAHIAERTGTSVGEIRNLLGATQTSRRG
ncbi:helix-turn-helix domain-containing protein [Streptomyces sp. NPDC002285]